MAHQDIIEAPDRNGSGVAGEILSAGGTVQQVRTSFCTAVSVQKAREISAVKRKLIEEARLMGEDAHYGWGAGKNAVEGPSIDLAVAAARCWGNCATDMLPVQDLPDCWIFTAAFIDLETGYTRTRQFRQSKGWVIHGSLDAERKDDVRFQIGQSKAERNVILKALPSWLINAALEAAKEGVRSELENLTNKHGIVHVADRLVSALMKCGVKKAAILAKCGIAERKGLTVDHLVILRGDLSALQNGQERAEVLFPLVAPPPPPAEAPLAAAPDTPARTSGKKVNKKTLGMIETWCEMLKLTPADKEALCNSFKVETFAQLGEEEACKLVGELADDFARRQSQPLAEREPGVDDDEDEQNLDDIQE